MKRFLTCLLIGALCLAAVPVFAQDQPTDRLSSVGFNVHGFYRVRYDNFFDMAWMSNEPKDDSNWWSWVDQRMILQPTLIISDPIQINMEFDILNNVMWGQNDSLYEPVIITSRQPNDPETIANVRYGTLQFPQSSVFSQSTSDTNTAGETVDPIAVRQLYVRVLLPIGYLQIGRQAGDFGMGIFANGGTPFLRFLEPAGDVNDRNSGFDADGGDVYDRFLFGSRVAHFYFPSIAYDRVAEDSFKSGNYDVHCFTLFNQFRDIHFADSGAFDAGFFLQSRTQDATNAKLWIYDLWLRLGYAGFTWEAEAMALQGTAEFVSRDTVRDLERQGLPTGERGGSVDAGAYLAAFRFNYDARRWGAGTEFGFSSPTDANPEKEFDAQAAANVDQAVALADTDTGDPTAKIDFIQTVIMNQSAFGRRINTFPFDPNYNVDLITWDKVMGGAVVNGLYAKATGYINPLDGMHVGLDVINSYINESGRGRNGSHASHDLGWEADVRFAYTFYKQFTMDTEFGWMLPGQYFRDVYADVDNIYTIQMRAIVEF